MALRSTGSATWRIRHRYASAGINSTGTSAKAEVRWRACRLCGPTAAASSTASAASTPPAFDDGRLRANESEEPPLVRLDSARLAYPGGNSSSSRPPMPPMSLSIYPPSAASGGHAVLGRNGSGKSLLHLALSHGTSIGGPEYDHLSGGSILFPDDDGNGDTRRRYKSRYPISSVSFESHHSLLTHGGSTYAALTPLGGRLSKAAEFLVVRFGLYPLLNRSVDTLSTGEIRKVLLVRALSTRPNLLLLDNAFDGLDVPSRVSLSDLVSKMLRGFRQDLLVQGVDARDAARTQVLMSTHRAEEIVDEIGVVSWLGRGDGNGGGCGGGIVTETRMGRSGARLLRAVHDGWDAAAGGSSRGGGNSSSIGDGEEAERLLLKADAPRTKPRQAADRAAWGGAIRGAWDDPDLPSVDDIAALMETEKGSRRGRRTKTMATAPPPSLPIVRAVNLRVARNEFTLLSDLTWTVLQGERWLVAGGNGAGKSTLSKLLTGQGDSRSDGDDSGVESLSVAVDRCDVGWVSTELHMRLARSSRPTRDVLLGVDAACRGGNIMAEATSTAVGFAVASWLGVGPDWLSRPFSRLSQGEQKMALIARAVASRPRLLVLDEPMQGLDWHNRRRVLGLVERLCRATDVSLVYITHHLEELLPSVSKVLHLREGRAVYNGDLDAYDPDEV